MPSSEHPDANLLAAFAENSLMRHERAAILAHLAECPECRESLAVASRTVNLESSKPLAHDASSRVRRFSPVWRWASGAAVALCVMGIVWQFRVGLPGNKKIQNALPATVPLVVSKKSEPAPEAPQIVRRENLTIALPPKRKRSQSPVQAKPNTNAAAMPEMMSSLKKSPVLPLTAAVDSASAQALSGERFRQQDEAVGMAHHKASHAVMSLPPSAVREPNMRWSINASASTSNGSRGVVERSTDGGKTWEVVQVNNGADFRAVAADGPDVWAGSSDGSLFHSSNGGSDWQQIQVAEASTRLGGAIVSIEIPDSQRVIVTTNSGERWISADGGGHWQRE